MGVIDDYTATIVCTHCKNTEVSTAYDRGNPYNGPYWEGFDEVRDFAVSWVGGGRAEPKITSAKCKKCSASADVSYNR